ncbi:MAG: TonB family protein [Proteobacteria bacterium]|nr:TonB family protein [Pseudomonadota bacterium]
MDGVVQCYLVTGRGFAGSNAASASRVECAAAIPERIVTKKERIVTQNSLRRGLGGLVLALSACGSTWAANGPIDFSRTARLALDANGKVDSLVFDDAKPGFAKVDARLESVIRQWAFVPGSIDGKPMPTQTTLSVKLKATPDGHGDYAVTLLDAQTGAGVVVMSAPTYPMHQLADGNEAVMSLAVTIDQRGVPEDIQVDRIDTDGSRQEFETAAITQMKTWRFRPETVGGHPLTEHLHVPVTFCVSTGFGHGPCQHYAKQLEATAKNGEDHVVTLDGQTKLLTQVAGTTLRPAAVQ